MTPEMMVLKTLNQHQLGRPSTLAKHCKKISGYLRKDGTCGPSAEQCLALASQILPNLTNPQRVREMQSMMLGVEGGMGRVNEILEPMELDSQPFR